MSPLHISPRNGSQGTHGATITESHCRYIWLKEVDPLAVYMHKVQAHIRLLAYLLAQNTHSTHDDDVDYVSNPRKSTTGDERSSKNMVQRAIQWCAVLCPSRARASVNEPHRILINCLIRNARDSHTLVPMKFLWWLFFFSVIRTSIERAYDWDPWIAREVMMTVFCVDCSQKHDM